MYPGAIILFLCILYPSSDFLELVSQTLTHLLRLGRFLRRRVFRFGLSLYLVSNGQRNLNSHTELSKYSKYKAVD